MSLLNELMGDKKQILALLRSEFTQWAELMASLSEAQIVVPRLPPNLSIKDMIARLDAALLDREPELPE
jgi:hypothetical protein